MQEQPQGELQPERVRVVRQESVIAKGLEDKLQNMLLAEPDVQNVMEGTAQLARAAERGEEPDFSWVPDRLRVQVMSEWNEARDRIVSFQEAQRTQSAERASAKEDLALKAAAEEAAKLEELETKFGTIPDMDRPISQRQIPTQIVRPEKPKTIFQKIRERLSGS